ncbi:SHC-transforming protein 1 [Aphelenchoides bicaudatus]|nr:SHC-transforming protein 1 [Aphelenchoides bicaudatus]
MVSVLPSQLTEQDLVDENNAQLQHGGMTFCIKYVGNIPIGVSMNFVTNSEQNSIGRTCIMRVLHAAKKVESCPELSTYNEYFLEATAEIYDVDVDMNISSSAIMILKDGVSMVHKFMIPDISLVVPGIKELSKYFTIFANSSNNKSKSSQPNRRCFVFFAEQEMMVIRKTIVCAFRIREKEGGKRSTPTESKPVPKARVSRDKTPTPTSSMPPSTSKTPSQTPPQADTISQLSSSLGEVGIGECRDRKRVPSRSASRSPLSSASSSKSIIYAVNNESLDDITNPQIRVEMATPNGTQKGNPPPLPPRSRNNSAISTTPHASPQRNELIRRSMPLTKQDNRRSKASEGATSRERTNSVAVNIPKEQFEEITRNLSHEPWFHGKLNRATAESYILENGQFLVRQSPNINNQIVLSGMNEGVIKHICLVDQDGFLKTCEGEFNNVTQLIKYYFQQRKPVTSDSSELTLVEPVYRRGIRFLRN